MSLLLCQSGTPSNLPSEYRSLRTKLPYFGHPRLSRTQLAQRQTEFAYHSIELYKADSLGSGSYGGVCKAKCDGLLCAGGTRSFHEMKRDVGIAS